MDETASFAPISSSRARRCGAGTVTSLVLGSVLMLGAAAASAQVCGEAIVNTAYTANNQGFASVATDPSTGDFMVVWESTGSAGADPGVGVIGQRFASDGSFLGSNFLVNEETIRSQRLPEIVFEPEAGEFVVVWISAQAGSSDYAPLSQIFGRRFDTAGSPIGGEFRIDQDAQPDTLTRKSRVGIADLPTGELVVAWSTVAPAGGTDDSGYSVQARRIDGSGAGVGGQFQVNVSTSEDQKFGGIAAHPSTGEFLVVWQDSSLDEHVVRRFDASGSGLGGELVIDPGEHDFPFPSVVADTANGGFRIVWSRRSADFSDTSIYARRLDGSGAWAGDAMQVNTPVDADESGPSIAMEPSTGAFWIAWTEYLGGSTSDGIVNVRMRRYDSTEMPTTAPTRINIGTFGNVSGPRVGLLPSLSSPGTYEPVVLWAGRSLPPVSAGLTDVHLAVAHPAFETGCPLLEDGFESGNAGSWQVVQ